jgi:chromosome segregation ATPase
LVASDAPVPACFMDDERDLEKLRAMLEAANAEKAAALSALQTLQRQGHEQTRLLMEEQDRFVSRLLGAQERDIGKLRLEFEEAKTTCERLHQKLRRNQEGAEKLEEELAKARFEMDRLREQRNTLRTEAQLARDVRATMQARIDQLEANLALAKTMLDDAMGEGDSSSSGFAAARNPLSTHRRLRPEAPRESGIARAGRLRSNSFPQGIPAITEIDVPVDTPRTATAASRSRPPR